MASVTKKVGKDTGKGKVELDLGDIDSPSPLPFIAIDLFNYNIDGNVPKKEHTDYLDVQLIPILKKENVHVKLRGTASRSGASEYNKQLSLGRVLLIKQYLIDHNVPEAKVPGPDVSAAGEELSKSASNEDERDRAVRITLAFGTKPKPLPVPKPRSVFFPIDPIEFPPGLPRIEPPPRDRPRRYKIQYLTGFGLSAGAGLSLDVFRIIDVEKNESATFNLAGAGVGTPGPSLTLPSENNEPVEFECMHQSLNDFQNEPASFSTVGVADQSLSVIVFPLLGVSKSIGTGFGLSPGASSNVGALRQTSRPQPHVPRGTPTT